MIILRSKHIFNIPFKTGRSDIPLLPEGEEAIKSRAPVLVGPGSTWMLTFGQLQHVHYFISWDNVELLDPENICHVFVSPRIRARRTFEVTIASTYFSFSF